jgi:hypothetical protein
MRAATALVVNQTADLSSLIGLCRRTHTPRGHTNAPANSAPRHTKKKPPRITPIKIIIGFILQRRKQIPGRLNVFYSRIPLLALTPPPPITVAVRGTHTRPKLHTPTKSAPSAPRRTFITSRMHRQKVLL